MAYSARASHREPKRIPVRPKHTWRFGFCWIGQGVVACGWLRMVNASEVVYWGDCDEAGYGILSSLRSSFPQVRSLLMDQAAWCQWNHLAVPGKRDITA